MALIPDDPKQRNALVVGIVALAGFYFFWSMWYSPRAEQVTALEAQLEQLDRENQRAQVVATRGQENLQERLALYERHVIQLEQLIPQSEEVPALLNDVAEQARRVGVEVALTRPEPEEVGAYYTKTAYEYQLIGDYHQIAKLLTAIASLPRIITPVDLELAEFVGQGDVTEGMEFALTATLRLETYILPAPGETMGVEGEGVEGAPPGGGR
jgi:type IV pilus assembly protein PilO